LAHPSQVHFSYSAAIEHDQYVVSVISSCDYLNVQASQRMIFGLFLLQFFFQQKLLLFIRKSVPWFQPLFDHSILPIVERSGIRVQ